MFLLLSSNAFWQGLTHVNKAVYVCRRFYLQLIACLFTRVSLDQPTKQRYINNKANANNMQVFIG